MCVHLKYLRETKRKFHLFHKLWLKYSISFTSKHSNKIWYITKIDDRVSYNTIKANNISGQNFHTSNVSDTQKGGLRIVTWGTLLVGTNKSNLNGVCKPLVGSGRIIFSNFTVGKDGTDPNGPNIDDTPCWHCSKH